MRYVLSFETSFCLLIYTQPHLRAFLSSFKTIYHAFDQIADKRGVFKVETVGDCYVAVCGLPEPRRDHAIVMARFARDCLVKVKQLVGQLELTLGPDTSELGMVSTPQ